MKKIFSILILVCALKAQAGIIADTLYMEARGEGEHGQRAIATVIYNRAEPITIVKYENPRRIEVSLDDCDNSAGVKVIDNVCGFVIWACKIKIFVINN